MLGYVYEAKSRQTSAATRSSSTDLSAPAQLAAAMKVAST
jgi:hypothetical protein